MVHHTLNSNGNLIVCTCFPDMPEYEYIFGEGYKEYFKGREHLDTQTKLYKKWRKKHGFEVEDDQIKYNKSNNSNNNNKNNL